MCIAWWTRKSCRPRLRAQCNHQRRAVDSRVGVDQAARLWACRRRSRTGRCCFGGACEVADRRCGGRHDEHCWTGNASSARALRRLLRVVKRSSFEARCGMAASKRRCQRKRGGMNVPAATQAAEAIAGPREQAARILVTARRKGELVERLPVELLPASLDDGFAIQQEVSRQLGGRIGALKCALPEQEKVLAAPIYGADIHQGGVCRLSGSPLAFVRAEPELALLLNRDLPP